MTSTGNAFSSVKNLIDVIKVQPQRMSFENLIRVLMILDEEIIFGGIDQEQWLESYDVVMNLSGWSEEELINEVDKRWSYVLLIKEKFETTCLS